MQFLEYRAASVRSIKIIKHLFLVSRRIRTGQFQHVVVSVWAKYDDLTVASLDILTSDDSNRRSVAPPTMWFASLFAKLNF